MLTEKQYAMLVAANGCSLPGDGFRIKGSGQHRVARGLEELGLVRVAAAPEQKARVHVTPKGRARREELGRVFMAAERTKQTVRQSGTLTHPDGKEERVVLETTLDPTTDRVTQRIVNDPLAGFLTPADAIVPCKMCGAAEGEPCRSRPKDKSKLKSGFVHVGRRVARLLLTAKARGGERERFEEEAVKMLREDLRS